MIQDLSYICSNCEKSVLGAGVFLSSNGIQEGFCSFACTHAWLGKKFAEHKRKVELKKKPMPPPPKVGKKAGRKLTLVAHELAESQLGETKKRTRGAPPPR